MAAMTQREIKAAVTVARARWVRDEIVKPDGTVLRLIPADPKAEKIEVDDPRRRHL